jgi:hypothetical protein
MDKVKTSWSDPRGATRPTLVVDSYFTNPGEVVTFKGPNVTVVNCGTRAAAIFLRADGLILTDGVPIARSDMPADTATWISRNVLTRTYLKSCGGVKLVRACSCQYGDCGHCGNGDHGKCVTRIGFEGKPPAQPVTRIVGRKGAALASVWSLGKSCRWICTCRTCAEKPPVKKPAYRRVTGGDPKPGDTVWLTPKTLAAPPICFKQPRATVVSVSKSELFFVVQVDGVEHRIHADNVRYSDPAAVKPRESRVPKPRKPMPEGYTEQLLF